jgi:RNA polymerase sigma factor (sigma-70 family)
MPSRLSPRHLLVLPSAGDRELLRAYVDDRDPSAFADLARRYTGLARRVAADICPSAADDVAQSTLTLLGRKAMVVAGRESAAGWIFETARRLAMKARTAAARRAKHEAHGKPPASSPDPLDALSFGEVRAAVAEEVARLPDDLRVPLVLCYWDGASQVAAANRLRCSLSTLKRRLDAGRERLATRLARRGFAGSAVLAVLTALSCRVGRSTAAHQSLGKPVEASIHLLGQVLRSTHSIKPALLMLAAATFVAIGGLALGLSPA